MDGCVGGNPGFRIGRRSIGKGDGDGCLFWGEDVGESVGEWCGMRFVCEGHRHCKD